MTNKELIRHVRDTDNELANLLADKMEEGLHPIECEQCEESYEAVGEAEHELCEVKGLLIDVFAALEEARPGHELVTDPDVKRRVYE